MAAAIRITLLAGAHGISPIPGVYSGEDQMRESFVERDEEILGDQLSDVALEVAAGKNWEVGNPFTIAFCSGLDTCPAQPH